MTTNRDFNRLARAWLDLMPDEAPDRLIANVRLAVDVTPQQRTWGRLAFRRPFQMTRFAFISATVVLVVALALAGGVVLLGFARPSPTVPFPTPSAMAGDDLPANLIDGWYGGPRDLPLLAAGYGTVLFLDTNEARLSSPRGGREAPILRESASMVGGRLQLVSTDPEEYSGGVTCPIGTAGTYDVSLSPSGRTLTVRSFSDPCGPRQAVFSGTWWQQGCPPEVGECYGALDPGTYGTQLFDPRVDPNGDWEPNYGALTFTVPDGWAFVGDGPSSIRLTPDYAGQLANGGVSTGLNGDIYLLAQPYPFVGRGDCLEQDSPKLGAPRSPTDIVAALEAHPWLVASSPRTTMIDGHLMTEIDISIAPGSKGECPEDSFPSAGYLATFPARGSTAGLAGDQRAHLWLIDLGAGDVVAAIVTGRDAAALDGFIDAARSVIESFRFE
jgi:hypothetical protein